MSHPRPNPRLVAVMRRRPVPEAQQTFDGGSFEQPAFHLGRLDSDGAAIIQLLVGNVVATSARLTPGGSGANHWWVDAVHTIDGYTRRGLATTLIRLVLAAADVAEVVVAIEPRVFGSGGPDLDQVVAWLQRTGFGAIRATHGPWLLRAPQVPP